MKTSMLIIVLSAIIGIIVLWPKEKIIEVPNANSQLPLDSLLNSIDSRVGELVSFYDLIIIEEFQCIMTSPKKYLKESMKFLADTTVNDQKKIILILAMHALNKEDFGFFVNFCSALYIKGKISENVIKCVILPGRIWSNKVSINFYQTDIRQALKTIKYQPANSSSFDSLLDDMLRGKLWLQEFLRTSAPQ